MRLLTTTALFAAALFATAAPAQDRAALELRLRSIEARLPDTDRLDRLERKVDALAAGANVADGDSDGAAAPAGNLFSLYQEIQALQQDVRELRGQVEELRHRAQQRELGQRDLYQDLDGRLRALEQKAGIVPSVDDGETAAAPETASDAEAADPEAVEKAYLAAFDKLKQGQHEAAIRDLNAFVEAHPDGEYADNAWYWLGEAHYVGRGYDKALAAFRRVLDDFPESSKAPGALYKIGVVQDEQGNYDAARKTLNEVIENYPEDNAAELARKRLAALDAGGGQ